MPLKDHYLVEDYQMMSDELENLHKTCMQVLDSAIKAEFTSKEEQLASINGSLNILKALHAKKHQQDKLHSYMGRY